jgi:hypothetical protein
VVGPDDVHSQVFVVLVGKGLELLYELDGRAPPHQLVDLRWWGQGVRGRGGEGPRWWCSGFWGEREWFQQGSVWAWNSTGRRDKMGLGFRY